RDAGTATGEYSFNLYEDGGVALGTLRLLGYSGQVSYERGPRNQITFNYSNYLEPDVLETGTARYRIVNEDTIIIPSHVLMANGHRYLVRRAVLNRTGNRYV